MRFYLSGNLMRFSDYEREVDVEADTIYSGIVALVDRYQDLRPILIDREGCVRDILQIFLDGEQITVEDLQNAGHPQANVTILTALAGG